jgi:hypothetical protein
MIRRLFGLNADEKQGVVSFDVSKGGDVTWIEETRSDNGFVGGLC